MSITDTTDDNTKTSVGGNTTDKDHQHNSTNDMEETKKAASKSTDGDQTEVAAELTNTVTEEEEEEAQVFTFDGKNYDTYQGMVDAKRERNLGVLARTAEAKAAIDAAARAAEDAKMKASTQKKSNKPQKKKDPPPPRTKHERKSTANKIDYSTERVFGSDEKKEEEAEKDEEQPIQTRSSNRARKPTKTFLDEAKTKIESKQVAIEKRGGKVLPMEEEEEGVLFVGWDKDLDNQLCRLEAITAKHSGGEGSGSGNNNGTDWVTISKGVPGNKSPKECRVRWHNLQREKGTKQEDCSGFDEDDDMIIMEHEAQHKGSRYRMWESCAKKIDNQDAIKIQRRARTLNICFEKIKSGKQDRDTETARRVRVYMKKHDTTMSRRKSTAVKPSAKKASTKAAKKASTKRKTATAEEIEEIEMAAPAMAAPIKKPPAAKKLKLSYESTVDKPVNPFKPGRKPGNKPTTLVGKPSTKGRLY